MEIFLLCCQERMSLLYAVLSSATRVNNSDDSDYTTKNHDKIVNRDIPEKKNMILFAISPTPATIVWSVLQNFRPL